MTGVMEKTAGPSIPQSIYPTALCDNDGVARVTIDRPTRMNAIGNTTQAAGGNLGRD